MLAHGRLCLLALLLASLLGAPAAAQESAAGPSEEELQQRIDEGDAGAKARLGEMLLRGRGIAQDVERGIALLKEAAEEGESIAAYRLGEAYFSGIGVRQNHVEAFYWYTRTVEIEPHRDGYFMIASMQSAGRGTERDNEKAFTNYLKAAELEQPRAMFEVGIAYKNGIGVAPDNDKANFWFGKAAPVNQDVAESGKLSSILTLGKIYEEGWGVPKDPAQAAKWFRLAAAEYERLAKGGDLIAMHRLAGLYRAGTGVSQDKTKLRDWLRKAAEGGYFEAQYEYAALHLTNHDGATRDYEIARKFFNLAAEKGHPDSQYQLGVMYARGMGVKRNKLVAYKWLTLAAWQELASAKAAQKSLANEMSKTEVKLGERLASTWRKRFDRLKREAEKQEIAANEREQRITRTRERREQLQQLYRERAARQVQTNRALARFEERMRFLQENR